MTEFFSTMRHRAATHLGRITLGVGLVLAPAAATTVWTTAAIAQDAMTPEQKVQKMMSQYTKLGGKVTFDSATEDGGVLTVKGMKVTMALPVDDPKKPGSKVKKSFLITLDEMVIRKYDYKNPELPLFADGEVKGMRFDGELVNNKEMSQFLTAVGLKELVMDAKFKYEANQQAGQITLDTYSITLREVMSFSLALKIDQIDFTKIPKGILQPGFGVPGSKTGPGKVKNPGQLVMQAMGKSRLHNLSISLTDLGGIERGMKFAAAEQSKKNPSGPKMTAQMMRAQVKGMLAFGKAKVAGTFANSVIDAAGKLLTKPGTLTLAAKPGKPVQFVSLMGFAVMMGAGAQKPGQKINLDALQGFLGLKATYTAAN